MAADRALRESFQSRSYARPKAVVDVEPSPATLAGFLAADCNSSTWRVARRRVRNCCTTRRALIGRANVQELHLSQVSKSRWNLALEFVVAQYPNNQQTERERERESGISFQASFSKDNSGPQTYKARIWVRSPIDSGIEPVNELECKALQNTLSSAR